MKTSYIFWLLISANLMPGQTKFNFPATAKHTISKTYFGTQVQDHYSWLESPNDSTVQKWVQKQVLFTDSFFNTISYLPKLEKFINRGTGFFIDFPASRKNYSFKLFYGDKGGKTGYEKSVPILYYRYKNDLQWREIINPLKFRRSANEHVVITNYEISGDEKYLAFCISRDGSDWQEVRVADIASGKVLDDALMWLKDNAIVWHKDGFFYQHFEKPPEGLELTALNQHEGLYYHRLNTSQDQDMLILEQGCEKFELKEPGHLIIYTNETIKRKKYYSISAFDVSGNNWMGMQPRKFVVYPAMTRYNASVLFVRNDSAFIRNNFLAGRGMIAAFSMTSMNEYKEIIPEYNEVLVNTLFYLDKLHCLYKTDTSYMMVKFDLEGKKEMAHEFERFISISDFEPETKTTAYYSETAIDRPRVLYRFNFDTYRAAMVEATYVKYEVSDFITRKVEYRSSDGTWIPMHLFYKKGLKITDQTPVLLTAYGGFGVINNPSYDYTNVLWAESGGVYAVTYIRGGGEKGKSWHMAGSGRNKQQCINDFIYAAKFLIENKYTRPSRLAITGASHGGLIVAAAVNQHPELFKAAIPVVGLFDMLNYQNYTVGKGFSDEFGKSEDSTEFSRIYRYSPYHHLKRSANTPGMLVITGDHDDRVPPFNSYKYVAACQDVSDNGVPILLHQNNNSGHNGGITQKDRVKEKAYFLAFLFHMLEIKPVFIY